jgi:transposase
LPGYKKKDYLLLNNRARLLNNEICERAEEDIERLDSIPGIARRMAEQILSEVGTNVKAQFPSAAHMCSLAGLVPEQNESAGKRKSAKTKKGNKYLSSALSETAHSFR